MAFEGRGLAIANHGSPTFFRPSAYFSAIDVTGHSPSLPIIWKRAQDTFEGDHYIFLTIPWFSRHAKRRISVINCDVY